MNSLTRKVGSATLSIALVLGSFAPIAAPVAQAAADGQLSVLINGQPPTGFCIAGTVTVSGSGKTGGQGGSWHLAVGWGNATTTSDAQPSMITSGTLGDKNKDFTYSVSTSSVTGAIRVVLYHSQESGQDGQVIVVNQCVAPPTQGVVIVKKLVINDNGGTATSSDFTLHINGNNFAGAENGTQPGFTLNPGAYQITENAKTGYAQSGFSCTVNGNATTTSNNTIQVYAGKNYVCTVTNNDEAPTVGTLKIIKHVINNNGGTATANQWTMSPGASSTPVSAAGSETGVDFILSPGAYNVSESGGPSGYTMSTSTNCSGTIAAGQSKTCTVTNDDQQASLTVTKQVTNIRKTNVAGDFNLLVGVTSVVTGVAHLFNAGTYTVSETNGTGYHTSFSGDCDSNGSVTLGVGQTKACTIINTEKTPGTLHIIKVVQNDNPSGFEGTATPGQFTLGITGGNPSPSSVAGTDAPGASVTIDADTAYNVTETGGPSGYGVSYSADCSTTMPEGGEKTCTVTNNDNSPTSAFITITKSVVNDNGGDAEATDWTLKVNDTTVSNGVATLFAPDTYTISETGGPSGYSQTSIMCSTDGGTAVPGASLSVAAGHSYVCTITNNDNAPSLTLVKQVTNDNGGDADAEDWTLGAVGPSTISGAGGAASGGAFQAGTYTLSESSGPSGYTAGDWSCSGVENDGNQITLGIGQSATCTIVNDDEPGTLHVVKTVINDNNGEATADDFSFKVNNGNSIQFEVDGTNDVEVNAGNYSVTEDAASGYGASLSDDCSGTIANGEEKTCIITNDDGKATLNIVKHTIGADGTFTFSLTGQEDPESLTTVNGWATSTIALNAGNYDVIETNIPSGWSLNNVSCVYDNESIGNQIQNGESVSIDPGDEVTCTFTNRATGADLTVDKTVDDTTPDANQNITYTITATNSGPAAIGNVTVTDLLPAGLSFVSTSTSDTVGLYSTSTGQWTIDSLAAGASATLHITVTVTASAGQTVSNSASISENDESINDFNDDNDTDSVSVTVNTPTPPPSGGGGGGGGGGGNGPISTIVPNNAPGIVLGASTEDCEEYLTSYIKYGRANNSAQVVRLQEFLNNFEANNLAVTGTYDQASLAAVHAFQTKYLADVMLPWGATKSSGFVYITTKKKINEIYCKFTKQFPLSADQEAEIARYRAAGQAYTTAETAPKIAPKSNNGVGAGVTLPAPTAPAAPKAPAKDEDATIGGTPSSQAASPATAPATGNWFTNFLNWLFK